MVPALDISGLHAWHGDVHILRGIDLRVAPGQAVAVVDADEHERTALLRTIYGLATRRHGSIRIHGTEAIDLPGERINDLGVGYSPDFSDMLSGLSCEENLLLTPAPRALGGGMPLADIYDMLPTLYVQRHVEGALLSCDEQRLLTVARILRTGADVLLLDDVARGLSPIALDGLAVMLAELKERGYAIVMAERNTHFIAPFADVVYLMEGGRIAGHAGAESPKMQMPMMQPSEVDAPLGY